MFKQGRINIYSSPEKYGQRLQNQIQLKTKPLHEIAFR